MSQKFPLVEHRHPHEHTGGSSPGAFIRLLSSGSGTNTVDRLTWDEVHTESGWATTVPLSELPVPQEGYYDLRSEIITEYSGDLTVSLEVDGSTVESDTITVSGQISIDVASGPHVSGSTLLIRFDPAIVITKARTLAQLVDRQTPDDTVDPWAWHRGDDLSSGHAEGDRVVFWSDRTGNGRDLEKDPNKSDDLYPKYTDDAVGGAPGIRAPQDVDENLFTPAYDAYQFPDGMTILLVVQPPPDFNYVVDFHMDPVDTSLGSVSIYLEKDFFEVRIAGGYFDHTPAETLEIACLAVQTPDEIRVWINGSEIQPDNYVAPDVTVESYRHLIQPEVPEGEGRVAEIEVWEEPLDASARDAVHADVSSRYGLG